MSTIKQRPGGADSEAESVVFDDLEIIEGSLDASGQRYAIIITEWNETVINGLLQGALDTLVESGASTDEIDVVRVPGAFELPLAADRAADSDRYDAIITLGAVIRGGTPHFDYVCRACTDGIREVNLKYGIPVAFGVLTTDNDQQALERAAPGDENKGREAALAAIRLTNTLRLLND